MRARILEATYVCIAREGLDRTTVEDAAREAGVSRATLYRWFPGGRDELLRETIAWQTDQFFLRLAGEVQGSASLDEVLATALRLAHRWIAEDAVLQRLVATEPGRLVPAIADETRRLVPRIARFVAPWLPPGSEARAEYVARIAVSLIGSPGGWDLDDPAQVEELVATLF